MKKNFRKKVLKNGLTVLFEKRDVSIVSLAIVAKVGGINESLKEKGISHFIEHMLYKGTKNRTSNQISSEIEKNGGELNGFTSEEMTSFWCKLPSNKALVGLKVLTDLVSNPLFDSRDLEKERKVIFEELKMRRDNPRSSVFDSSLENLYKKPFGADLIGSYKSMNSLTREDLVKRWEESFSPENLVLCCVGDFDFNKLVDFGEKNFIRRKSFVKEFKVVPIKKKSFEKRKGLGQSNFVFGFHGPLIDSKLSPAFYLLFELMGGGLSSRLFSEIREKRNLAYEIKAGVDSSKKYCHSFIYVGSDKKNIPKIRRIIFEEFKKVSKGLTQKELDEIKTQVLGNHLLSMEDSQGQMVSLLNYEISGGGAEKLYNFEKRIKSVSLSDVKKVASSITLKNSSFFGLIPKD